MVAAARSMPKSRSDRRLLGGGTPGKEVMSLTLHPQDRQAQTLGQACSSFGSRDPGTETRSIKPQRPCSGSPAGPVS